MKNLSNFLMIILSIIILAGCSKDELNNNNSDNVIPVFDQSNIVYIFEDGNIVTLDEIDTSNENYYWLIEPYDDDSVNVFVFTNQENFYDFLENQDYGEDLIELEYDMAMCREYALENKIDSIYEQTEEIPEYFWDFEDSIRNTIQTRCITNVFILYDGPNGSGSSKVCPIVPNPSLGNFRNRAESISGLLPSTILCDFKWWGGRKYFIIGGFINWNLSYIGAANKIDSYFN